ncbi:hypothetical protein NC653_004934 [Populus alba x Populus x berolinensis]|uniref:Uncharacterized protein n=1 Tax=Populus alba x Populus x berolinensis TaxID=444605 RepID=A0AAD6WAH3_9ROSI|nr:hypothetical protein NC653_004934 [Populus alba x Populus x berolinensis]
MAKWKKKCMGRLKRERRKIKGADGLCTIFSFSIMRFLDKHGTLSSQESRTFVNLGVVLNFSMTGHESDRVSFDFFVWSGKYVECLLLGQKSRVASSLGRLSPFHSLSLLIYISFGIVHRTPCSSLSFELKSPSDISFFAVFQLQLILFSYRLESSSLVRYTDHTALPKLKWFHLEVCQYRKKTGLESSKGLAPLDYGDLFLWSGAMALLKISPLYQTTDRICYGTE